MLNQKKHIKTIMRAVRDLGLSVGATDAQVAVPYAGWRLYNGPNSNLLNQVGVPYLTVNRPKMLGYWTPDSGIVSGDMARQIGTVNPAWEIEVYSFHKYDETVDYYFDDATDDANNLEEVYFDHETLPYSVALPAGSTTTVIQLPEGEGANFRPYRQVDVGGMLSNVDVVVGDTLQLAWALPTAPAAGVVASQGTCFNSYPVTSMPEYAQLSQDGGEWTVGYVVLRVYENLTYSLP